MIFDEVEDIHNVQAKSTEGPLWQKANNTLYRGFTQAKCSWNMSYTTKLKGNKVFFQFHIGMGVFSNKADCVKDIPLDQTTVTAVNKAKQTKSIPSKNNYFFLRLQISTTSGSSVGF